MIETILEDGRNLGNKSRKRLKPGCMWQKPRVEINLGKEGKNGNLEVQEKRR